MKTVHKLALGTLAAASVLALSTSEAAATAPTAVPMSFSNCSGNTNCIWADAPYQNGGTHDFLTGGSTTSNFTTLKRAHGTGNWNDTVSSMAGHKTDGSSFKLWGTAGYKGAYACVPSGVGFDNLSDIGFNDQASSNTIPSSC